MNTRAFTLALIIAAVAMFMMQTYIADKEAEMIGKYGVPKTVVVAKVDIQELDLIDDSKITIMQVPNKFVHPDAFNEMKALENTIATVPIKKGEVLTKPRVTFPGVETGLSRQISVGKRAISLQITEKQAVGKLIKPGDRVDVIAAIDYSQGRTDLAKTATILQDVPVLSTGRSMTNSIPMIGVKVPGEIKKMKLNTYDQYNTVTLELDPFEVQKLVFLLTYSREAPYLSLRNNSDRKKERINSTKIFDILGEDAGNAKEFFRQKYSK